MIEEVDGDLLFNVHLDSFLMVFLSNERILTKYNTCRAEFM